MCGRRIMRSWQQLLGTMRHRCSMLHIASCDNRRSRCSSLGCGNSVSTLSCLLWMVDTCLLFVTLFCMAAAQCVGVQSEAGM